MRPSPPARGRGSAANGWLCPKCGTRSRAKESIIVHGIEKRRNDKFADIGLIDDPTKLDPAIHPIDDSQRCGRCGNWGAYYYLLQTRRADEPTTRFYRCTKCGKQWKSSK
ncbi:MAG: RPA12/RPB9/RPC11 RNA polymerase family protein [Thermoplasmatota archaeon]